MLAYTFSIINIEIDYYGRIKIAAKNSNKLEIITVYIKGSKEKFELQ